MSKRLFKIIQSRILLCVGTTSFDGKVGYGTSATNLSSYHAVDVDHVSTSTGHGDLVRWHDSGDVVVKVTGSTDDLVAGLYTSTIYFHVVTDF